MNISELCPLPKEKIAFKLSSFKLVPKIEGCYVLATFNERILYIGLASNLYNRFKQHLENPEKTKPTIEGKAIWFFYTVFDHNNLPKLERTWLNQYINKNGKRPILNKIDSPIS
jgi:excinuclease UvrABC nuclease subunit